MKKVAVLYSGGSGYGGIYTFFRDIINDIKKENKDIQIDIFSITDLPPGKLFDNEYLIKLPNFLKKFLFKFNLHIPFSSLFIPFFFLKKLKTYDKIILNQESAFPLGKLLKKSITIIHGTSNGPARYWWNKKKYLYSIYFYLLHLNCILTYKFSNKIYTVSEYTKNLIKNYNKNIKVCGWGVDLDFWRYNDKVSKKDFGFNNKDFLMIFVGRFDTGKGKEDLINIMKNIKDKNVKLICISKKPDNFKDLEKINIFFFENINENRLIDLYSISDLFVFPTKYEGYGSVIAEALSIGLPIVTTNVGLGDILQNKYENKYKKYLNILDTLDDYKKYINIITKIKENNLEKIKYNIEEINIQNALHCWKKVFID